MLKYFSKIGTVAFAAALGLGVASANAATVTSTATTCLFGSSIDFTASADVYTSTACVGQLSGNDSTTTMSGLFGIANWSLDSKWDQTTGGYVPSGLLGVAGVTSAALQGTWSVANWSGIGSAVLVLKGGSGWAAYLLDMTAGTSGAWITQALTNNGGQQPAISHISLYTTVAQVPVPAAGVLLIGALGGLGFVGRRRRKAG